MTYGEPVKIPRGRNRSGLKPPWPKGVSGNPGGMPGRPKGASILGPIFRMLASELNEHGEGSKAVELARIALERASRGEDITSILKLVERTDGSVVQKTEHSGITQIISKRVRTSDLPHIKKMVDGT